MTINKESKVEFNVSPNRTHNLSDEEWRKLNNYEKERIQLGYINKLIMEEVQKHPNIEVQVHFRTKKGRTTDADTILLKDGKVKDQVELAHLWYESFRNVSYALNPRRQALLECPQVEISESFKSWYIQNGGRYDPYLLKACKDHSWSLHRFPLIYHMTRRDHKRMKWLIHQIFIHAISEPREYVYDRDVVDPVLFGEVVDVAVDDAYVSFTREDLVTCAPLMRGFCGLNPDSPNVEVDFPYLAYDLSSIRWRNSMIAKYMIQSEEIHEIIKGLVHHSG